MSDPPLLSVIVPCRNSVTTLETLLDSLLDQRSPVSFEVLLCDNGSTDDLRGFAQNASTPGIDLRYVDASEHRGAAFARNRGIGEARSEHLAFCDADDAVGPAWVRSAFEALQRIPVVNGSAVPVSHEDFADPDRLRAYRHRRLRGDVPADLPLAGLGDIAPALMAGTFAARRGFLVQMGGFDASLWRGGEDNDLSYRIAATGLSLQETDGMGILYRSAASARSRRRKSFHHALSLALVCARHDAWHEARSYRTHPAVTLARSLGALGMMLLGRRDKDVESAVSRASNSLGLLEGLVRYKYLSRIPPSRVGQGLGGAFPRR